MGSIKLQTASCGFNQVFRNVPDIPTYLISLLGELFTFLFVTREMTWKTPQFSPDEKRKLFPHFSGTSVKHFWRMTFYANKSIYMYIYKVQ